MSTFRKFGTVLIVIALVFSSMGIAVNASACPMKQGDMQMMDCADDCPNCVSQNDDDDRKNNCCDDGFAQCGTSSSSVFYAPATAGATTFDAAKQAFVATDEHSESASLTPDKQPPPRILS